jgi:hypothetical protein
VTFVKWSDHVLGPDTHANRPSASAVPVGTLYSCTDHVKIYRSDGASTWSDYADIGGTGIPESILDAKGDLIVASAADTAAKLTAGANGLFLTTDSGETTGLKWATGGGGVGNVLTVSPSGFDPSSTSSLSTASTAIAMPVRLPGTMLLREFLVRVGTGAAGTTNTWGLYSYASSATACTELATGVGALASTGWQALYATGGPITVASGNYMLIFRLSAATAPTVNYNASATAGNFNRSQTSYTWDTTPDLTTGWSATSVNLSCYLRGDLDGSNQWG